MRPVVRILLLVSGLAAAAAQAQISKFQHIVVVFQENRTPDNLFYRLCLNSSCSTAPNAHQYNIQLSNWLDKTSTTGVRQPVALPLANGYGLNHNHDAWKSQCHLNNALIPAQCRMDGAAATSKNHGSFAFVENTVDSTHPNGILSPYLMLATQYGWANYMFQTNQGPSYPAHQFIFGGTSALSAADDQLGIFIAENLNNSDTAGCYAKDGGYTELIDSSGKETRYTVDYASGTTLCVTRNTMATLLDSAGFSWKYYAAKTGGANRGGSIWTAPNTIESICVPDVNHENCTGTEWANHVDLVPSNVFKDLGTGGPCNLAAVSWVTPTGANSDHAGASSGGPDWVASIVNAIGESRCTNPDGSSYWNTTAIVITWDDWGGWYDHVPPALLGFPEGGYQMGFRVPLIFVSAYTPVGYIDNTPGDFGTILRFIESNFGLGEGGLGFADARATTNLSQFYDLRITPRKFQPVPSSKTPLDFVNDRTPPTDPDDD